MSKLDPMALRKHMWQTIDLDLMERFNNVTTKDKELFEDQTNEEDTINEKREKTNIRMLAYVREAKKIMPMNEIINNIPNFVAFNTMTLIYDESICTKLMVNFQLYHKTVSYLGTE